jgi:hypothetical protein
VTAPTTWATRLLVAAPMALALTCGGWVLESRTQSAGSGFCTSYQAAVAEMFQRSGPISASPTPDDAVRLLSTIDIDQLVAATPPDLRGPLDRLAQRLPKLRRELKQLPPGASALALVPPDVIRDVTTLGNAYGKRCE